ncbi:MAG: peptidylprolyl isomerase, partial [Planctomycetota bacterium]
PTSWLNNKHTIFGQVISGMNIVDKVINVSRDSNDRPYNPPLLQNVQIFSSTQDATVTLYAADGFTGEAHVTVTLDDGHGGVTHKDITLRPLADLGTRPTINTDSVTTMTAGVAKVITPTYLDDHSMPMTYTASTSNSLVTASIDQATGQLTLNAPATFSGILKYEITAVEAGWADLTPTSFVASVFVHSVSEVPFRASTLAAYKGTSNYAMSGFGVGNTLYVANSGQGLARYDLTDPTNPVKQAWYTSNFSGARDVQVVGSTAFVADTWNGFKAFTVSDPTKFTPLGSAVATGGAAVSFAISGTTAWVADYSNGITAVDIANPAAMTKIGSFRIWTGKATLQYVMGVAIRGNTLYATDNAGWVIALDITDRTAPAYLGAFRAGPSPWGIQTYGNTGLLVTDGYTLRLWNVANPAKPTILSQVAIPGAWQVSLRGSLAVVAGDNSFTFVDLANPGKPRVEYTYTSPVQGGQPVFMGPNVILPMGGSGFSILAAARTLTTSGTIVLPVGGVATTVSLGGGGTAQIFTTDTGPAAITGIHVIGGTSKTTLTIKTASNAAITGGDITVDGSLKSLTAATLDLRGNLSVTGSLQTLALHSVSGGRTITIAATDPSKNPAAALAANLGSVSDLVIDSEIPLASLTATTWTSLLPALDKIDAPSLGTLTVKGPFVADLVLDGRNSPARILAKATISGALGSLSWALTGGVGPISVAGPVDDWTLDHATTIASLTLGNVANAVVDASGALGAVKALRWADGSIHADTIASLAVTGALGGPAGDFGADLTLDGPVDPTKPTAGKLAIAGTLTGTWAFAGGAKTIAAATIASGWVATFANGDVAGITVAGNAGGTLSARSIKSLKVGGDWDGAHLTLTQVAAPASKLLSLGSLTVAGTMRNSDIFSAGNIGAVTLGAMDSSRILAGVKANTAALPTIRADFVADDNALASIARLTIRATTGTNGLANSNVAAWFLGKVAIKNVLIDNSSTPFGLAAHSLTSYSRTEGIALYQWTSKLSPWPTNDQPTLAGQNDFAIVLVA